MLHQTQNYYLFHLHNADIDAGDEEGQTPLFKACVSGNIAAVKCLLENRANPNVTDQYGQTTLHFICSWKSESTLEIIQLLLKHNADINAVNKRGETLLFKACVSGNIAAVKCLLENHANPNVTDRNGQTTLHFICSWKSESTLKIIQLLLKHNADINAVNQSDWTPLFEACAFENIVAVKCLLENHANPNVTDRNGRTALHLISSRKSESTLEIIQLLLKHNADIDAADEEGQTPLFKACAFKNIAAVECLLENHANPNVTDRNGQTTLHLIWSRKSESTLEIIQLLLKHNAYINAVNKRGETLLFKACVSDNIAAVECLLENHANPNVMDRNGQTALHLISSRESETTLRIIQLLLKHNADIDAADEEGQTPLFKACAFRNIAAVKCLLENHAYPNVTDRNGQTALHVISSRESETTLRIIQLLLKHNANVDAVNQSDWTPLFKACVSGNIAAVKCLLENHANPNVTDQYGQTTLHLICSRKSEATLEIIQLLLKHNADIDAADEEGQTPLFKACAFRNIAAVKCLLENHANPDVTFQNGRTALHLISSRKSESTLEIIQLLLKHNADINAVNKRGETPLLEACVFENIVAVECLLRYGANINILDKRNQSPLQCAVDKMLSTSSVNSNIYMIIKILMSRIIKLKTASLNVNAFEFITNNGVKYSAIDILKFFTVLDDTIDTLDINCGEEMEKMKMESIGIDDVFLYDLLTQHIHFLGILMENEKIQGILKPSIYDEKFPLSIGIIRFRLRDAEIRYRQYKLKKSAREYFSSNINQELPHECIDKVLDYLTVVDLKTFIRSFEPSRGE